MSNGVDVGNWIFGTPGNQRFTQDSPVLPEVWTRFAAEPEARQDLLLTPHQDSSAAELISVLSERLLGGELGEDGGEHGVAYNEGYVVAWVDFTELLRAIVPLSSWWAELWPPGVKKLTSWVSRLDLEALAASQSIPKLPGFRSDWLFWYLTLVGRIELSRGEGSAAADAGRRRELEAGAAALEGLTAPKRGSPAPLWAVNVNRVGRTALYMSRLAVKADAAERVFAVEAKGLRWAIVDTGVDATHPAFRRRTEAGALLPPPSSRGRWENTRVVATYDFTRLRPIVSGRLGGLSPAEREQLQHRVNTGQALDWDSLAPLLAVPHGKGYEVPKADHGTHIGGIVGGDWRVKDAEMPARNDLIGICPDIELYDLRVFDSNGVGEEFAIAAALQFIRHLNGHSDLQVVHGANLSLSLDHELANYAVGRTPICDECERLMSTGVVVVAAAGNEGQTKYLSPDGIQHDGFRTVAITDPGNADGIITVGSTHRQNPHTYGVSYFSSRGPTGDGRFKPDLVAPGEKIAAPAPGGDFQVKDGTSQATAHVSGVAAMLMARHPELMAQPRQIKEILCSTATDLGRERYFQGAGLIDALRALQEV